MKYYFIFLLLILLNTFWVFMPATQYSISEKENLVNLILHDAAIVIKKKYNLKPSGSGVAMPDGIIEELTLEFDTDAGFSKENLRELLINSAHDFIQQVKQEKTIEKFLKDPPFSIKNIQIIIYNHDKNGFSLCSPEISVAEIAEGFLTYSSIDPENTFRYKNEFKETYEEALAIINKQLGNRPN